MIIPIKLKKIKSNKIKIEKTLEDKDRKFFKCPSGYLFAFPQKRLLQGILEFTIALEEFIVPRLILTCDKDCFFIQLNVIPSNCLSRLSAVGHNTFFKWSFIIII